MKNSKPTITPERLAASPSLLGTPPADMSFAPGGRFAVFRGPDITDRERFNLYRVDLETMEQSVWLDSRMLRETTSDVSELSAEERAQRERRRDFSHGISSYLWRPESEQILLPIDGQAFLVSTAQLSGATELVPQMLCPRNSRQLGFSWSKTGRFLSFVRNRDLHFLDVPRDGENSQPIEVRVTSDASETVQNGLPDFLAAEEMHRFTGHWWSPDEKKIFYTRTDESGVAISHRLEIDAGGARTVPQRYPFAGAQNPSVELWCYELDSGKTRCLYTTVDADEYLARVYPLENGVMVLIQDRLQHSLTYRLIPPDSDLTNSPCVFSETSETWVNLTDDFLQVDGTFITTDESLGTRQIVEFGVDGETRRYDGITHTSAVLHADEHRVIATGWQESPTENHLYVFQRDSGKCHQVTTRKAWHDLTIDFTGQYYIDRLSSQDEPLRIEYAALPHVDEQETSPRTIYSQKEDPNHPYASLMETHIAGTIDHLGAEDGHELYYRVTPPTDMKEGERYPVILYVYGGPGAQKVRNEWNPLLNQMFAQHGFGVFELDNRGSTNRGRDFEAPLYQGMGDVEVRDQLLIFDVLANVPWADKSKVGVFGHSYGGYMSLLLMCQADDRFAAGVAVAPVCDWSLYDSHYTERYMSTPELNADGYLAGNVLSHLEKLNRPLLLMHGMADDNVLFTNSTMIMAELQRLNKSFELMTYPGAKHSMQETTVTVHRFNQILRFFAAEFGS
ncbi:MAG: alpha/beta fold hydrolase [Pseudomonadales bacterium]|nr:alpha/beta fold hydrolase [Pseudomonadales bacterium]